MNNSLNEYNQSAKSLQEKMEESGLLKPVVDTVLYSKLMKIDPTAARTFIQTRLDNLKAQLEPIKEEIRQLNEIISYDKDREIRSYYEKTDKIKKVYGITAQINAYFMENIGKEIRASHIFDYLKSIGVKVTDVGQISMTLSRMFKKGMIKNPYRGVYKMEENR